MTFELLTIPDDKEELEVEIPALNKYHLKYNFTTKQLDEGEPLAKGVKESSYIINKDLVQAVNAAIVTGRPPLLKGEPGCGKTKLAKAVACALYKAEEVNKYYFEWFVKSKSQARDGCYNFDHIQRLRDATLAVKSNTAEERVELADNYLSLGPLGKALVATPPKGKPILLIDEIDKGDIDFPNDLLLELDELRFTIKEKNDLSLPEHSTQTPLVFITSNDERELPPAFLRRCLIFRIPPFGKDLLTKIAKSKMKDLYTEMALKKTILSKSKDMEAVIDKFIALRKSSITSNPPSTSELLDWLKLIAYDMHEQDKKLEELLEDEQLQMLALKIM